MKLKFSLSAQVMTALVLGVATGLFLGNKAAILKPIGTAFVLFLQAPVLLFMLGSIIAGLASLSVDQLKKLALYGGVTLLILMGLTVVVIHLLPFGFPSNPGGYFASSNDNRPSNVNFFEILIPANPFFVVANGIVPATVIFGIIFAIALVAIPQKAALLDNLRAVRDAAARIGHTVGNFAPFGVYALSAYGVGTIPRHLLAELRFYYVAYCFATAFISFVVLPGLVWALTGYSYRSFFKALHTPMLIAVTTGPFVVLPMIAEAVRGALAEQGKPKESEDYLDSLLPLAYTFPSAGRLFIVFFILFVSWLYNMPVNHVELVVSGFFESFTSTTLAIPNLLKLTGLPYAAFDLFLPSTVLTFRLNSLMDVTSIASLCLIVACAANGLLKISVKRLGIWLAICSAITVAYIYITPIALGKLPIRKPVFDTLTISNPVSAVVHEQPGAGIHHGHDPDVLKSIKARGSLRVGYNTAVKPFAYFNDSHELVGYDIELAHILARTIGVTLEFIPLDYSRLAADLDNGVYDIAMSSVTITPARLTQVAFSFPYFESDYAFLVRDNQSKHFEHLKDIKNRADLRIAYLRGTSWEGKVKADFPKAQLIALDALDDFAQPGIADAMMWSADQGKTWTIIHPGFMVVVPKPGTEREVYAYAIAHDQLRLLSLVNQWLALEKNNGSLDRLYSHWILGQSPESPESQDRKAPMRRPSPRPLPAMDP